MKGKNSGPSTTLRRELAYDIAGKYRFLLHASARSRRRRPIVVPWLGRDRTIRFTTPGCNSCGFGDRLKL